MHQIHELIKNNGDWFYLITFLWTALEGETFVVFAGLAAQKGLLNIWLLFVTAWLGSMCGDQIFFILGRQIGAPIVDHLPKLKPGIEKAICWLEKYAVAFILSYRFMYGLRNVSSIAVGLSHLHWKKFAFLNAIAAFIWAVAFVGFGYLFGDVIAHLPHKNQVVTDSVRDFMLSVLAMFALIIVIKLVSIRRKRAKARRLKASNVS
jgi:membrane protein DedA with SNARE-associated domain